MINFVQFFYGGDSEGLISTYRKLQQLGYNEAVLSLFTEQEIIKGAGLFSNEY